MGELRKANIACGPNMFFDGWENLDKVDMSSYLEACKHGMTGGPEWQMRFIQRIRAGEPLDFRVKDVRYGLPYASDSVDLLYAGQFIEHLNPVYEAPKFLKECYRVLKPGGRLRMSTPDLDILFKAWSEGTMDTFNGEQPQAYKDAKTDETKLAYIMYGSLGPNSTAENYEGHMMIYSRASMRELLEDAGFVTVTFHSAGESDDLTMQVEVVDMGGSHSLFVEALK